MINLCKRKLSLALIAIVFLVVSCGGNDLEEAEKSLTGSWTVNKIYTQEGQQLTNGQTTDFDTLDLEAIGELVFNADGNASGNYSTLGTTINIDDTWMLDKSKVNCGFTNCDQYTLTIGALDFLCAFGDQTSDAHENATELSLTLTQIENTNYTEMVLDLSKI